MFSLPGWVSLMGALSYCIGAFCRPSTECDRLVLCWGKSSAALTLLQILEVVGWPILPELLQVLLIGFPQGNSIAFDISKVSSRELC